MSDVAVVGIGNPYRGDDAAGWHVVDILGQKAGGSVRLEKLRGDVAELLDIFSASKSVYIVDACFTGSAVGTIMRIDALKDPLPKENAQTSTHGLGVSEAIAIARNLDALPQKLIVFAIEGDHFNMSDTLSADVAKSVGHVADKLISEELSIHA